METPSAASSAGLETEAAYLHRAIFRAEISPRLARKYAQAHEYVQPKGPAEEFATIEKMVALGLDAEAVEMALRRKGRTHALAQKMKILVYLAEAETEHYGRFINERPSFTAAGIGLFYHGLRTVYKALKGRAIRSRYDLA